VPEQAQGRAVSALSDLLRLGGILYEVLRVNVPFEADTAVSSSLQARSLLHARTAQFADRTFST